jgi:predicted nuclease of predicted toxin-antitoxin system
MPIRLQADADLNQMILLAVVRREPAIDFQTATAAGLAGVVDEIVLAQAAREGRVLVTHDHRTMSRHFATFIARQPSAGLIIAPQSIPIARAVEDLLLIHAATEAEEWANRLVYLPL